MEYRNSRKKEIECNDDYVFKKYVWSDIYG